MTKNYFSSSESQTMSLGRLLAEEVLKTKPDKRALVLALVGELGAGKTTFIKSFIYGIGVKGRVTSPTFIIWRRFKLPELAPFKNIFHVDSYRIRDTREILSLGLDEVLAEPRNIVIVEWGDKIAKALPRKTIWIKLRHGQKADERHITLNRR